MLAQKLLSRGFGSGGEPLSITSSDGFYGSTGDTCITGLAFGSVTVSGGTPPYTFTWSKVGGSGSIATGQGTDTMGAAQYVCPNDSFAGVYRCNVDDANGGEVFRDVNYYWDRVPTGEPEPVPPLPPTDPEITPEEEEI